MQRPLRPAVSLSPELTSVQQHREKKTLRMHSNAPGPARHDARTVSPENPHTCRIVLHNTSNTPFNHRNMQSLSTLMRERSRIAAGTTFTAATRRQTRNRASTHAARHVHAGAATVTS